MAINTEFDEGWNPDRADPPAPGRYHVAIVALDENGGKRNEMVVDFEVLSGTVEGQSGRVQREYFQKTIKAMGRIHQLALACGMVTVEQLKAWKEAGTPPTYDFEGTAIGRQLMIELTEEEYEGKKRVRCGFSMFRVDDPKCASWPKNAKFLADAGIKVPDAKPAVDDKAMFEGVV